MAFKSIIYCPTSNNHAFGNITNLISTLAFSQSENIYNNLLAMVEQEGVDHLFYCQYNYRHTQY